MEHHTEGPIPTIPSPSLDAWTPLTDPNCQDHFLEKIEKAIKNNRPQVVYYEIYLPTTGLWYSRMAHLISNRDGDTVTANIKDVDHKASGIMSDKGVVKKLWKSPNFEIKIPNPIGKNILEHPGIDKHAKNQILQILKNRKTGTVSGFVGKDSPIYRVIRLKPTQPGEVLFTISD